MSTFRKKPKTNYRGSDTYDRHIPANCHAMSPSLEGFHYCQNREGRSMSRLRCAKSAQNKKFNCNSFVTQVLRTAATNYGRSVN
jgi:hypothetical protein